MENEFLLQAIEFLDNLSSLESHSNNLSKLIRKKFPHWSLPLIGLVSEQSELRKKALKKFRLAPQMLFTKKGLEQSTSEALSLYTASLFNNAETILDVCSGIGGNTIGLQNKFNQVTTIEPDPLLNAIHDHNLKLYYPTKKIYRIVSELNQNHLREHTHLFIDPDRRTNGKRSYSLEDHSPDMKFILENSTSCSEIIIKLSPMVNADQTEKGFKSLYIADEMELKQNIWLGGSLINSAPTFAIHYNGSIFDSLNLPNQINKSESGEYIFEMNPAIIKSGESFNVAQKYHLEPISETSKHFIGSKHDLYPFANSWKILLQEPFHAKTLTSILQSLPFERFEIKPYGIEESDISKLINKWGKGQGAAATVFIFKQKDFKQVIIGEKLTVN